MKLSRWNWRLIMRVGFFALITLVLAALALSPAMARDEAGDRVSVGGDTELRVLQQYPPPTEPPPTEPPPTEPPPTKPPTTPTEPTPTEPPTTPTPPTATPTQPPATQVPGPWQPPRPTSTPVFVGPPEGLPCAGPEIERGPTGYGETLPCTNCDLAFADGVYRLVDVHAASRSISVESDDLTNFLWAGGTLFDAVREQQGDLRVVRDAVDAERYRALSNSDYLKEDRPDLCCEGDCCPSSCVGPECSCVEACGPPMQDRRRR